MIEIARTFDENAGVCRSHGKRSGGKAIKNNREAREPSGRLGLSLASSGNSIFRPSPFDIFRSVRAARSTGFLPYLRNEV